MPNTKKPIFFIVLFLFFLIFPSISFANSFDVYNEVRYQILIDGTVNVEEKVTIKNKTEFTYSPSYTASLSYKDIENIKVENKNKSLPFEAQKQDELTIISVSFPDRIVGLGKENEFTIFYRTKSVAKKGLDNLWEVTLPGISKESFVEYNVYVEIPKSFPNASIVKPHQEFDTQQKTFFLVLKILVNQEYIWFSEITKIMNLSFIITYKIQIYFQ